MTAREWVKLMRVSDHGDLVCAKLMRRRVNFSSGRRFHLVTIQAALRELGYVYDDSRGGYVRTT